MVADPPRHRDAIGARVTVTPPVSLKLEAAKGPVQMLIIDHAEKPAAMMIQTIAGPVTVQRWAEICQTTA